MWGARGDATQTQRHSVYICTLNRYYGDTRDKRNPFIKNKYQSNLKRQTIHSYMERPLSKLATYKNMNIDPKQYVHKTFKLSSGKRITEVLKHYWQFQNKAEKQEIATKADETIKNAEDIFGC